MTSSYKLQGRNLELNVLRTILLFGRHSLTKWHFRSGTHLTLNMELGLKTPQAMGVSAPSVTITVSPDCGWGFARTLSTAPLYTMGLPLRKIAVLPFFRTTLGIPATNIHLVDASHAGQADKVRMHIAGIGSSTYLSVCNIPAAISAW